MYAYGKSVVRDLIKNGVEIEKTYIYEQFPDKKLFLALQKLKINMEYCSKKELDRLVNGNHQGIIVSIPDYEFVGFDELVKDVDSNSLILLLDHLEDPHNLGAIVRTCEAAGVEGIIIPNKRSVDVNSTVMKVSAGALGNVKICLVANLNNAISRLKERGFWIVGTKMESPLSYADIDYDMPICLVIGNEGAGMSRLISESCDHIVSIPMYGKVNSLNASVAAGIMIYGVLEKRKK